MLVKLENRFWDETHLELAVVIIDHKIFLKDSQAPTETLQGVEPIKIESLNLLRELQE